jgi:hypothetical protein
VAIDLKTERLITLEQAAAIRGAGHTGRPSHRATILRHAKHGVRRADGSRVFLEVIRFGGGFRTSIEALQRFIDALAVEPVQVPKTPTTIAARRRERELERAR